MTGGYTGYQHLLSRIAGIQQCCQHVIRRCRAVQKLGPGGAQNWAGDIIAVLGQAHRAVEDARARGDTALDHQVPDDLRQRYDAAVRSGIIHNRLRGWDTGNHPGYSLGCWLRDYKEQVRGRLFTFCHWCARHEDIPGLASLAQTISRWEDQIVTAVLTGARTRARKA
jgi:hypothetical protein